MIGEELTRTKSVTRRVNLPRSRHQSGPTEIVAVWPLSWPKARLMGNTLSITYGPSLRRRLDLTEQLVLFKLI